MGFTVVINKMMKIFKGRSIQTFRMKNKPVKEGYKFWAICDSATGYCYKFMPAARIGRADEEGRKVIDSTLALIKALPLRDTKKYVVAMDNYFTWPRTMRGARELGVATFGTAKGKRGWPPKEVKNVEDNRFNTLYWMVDKDDYLIMRWVDNNVVTMVSNFHQPHEKVKKERKKLRTNIANKKHVESVWGSNPKKLIEIPKVINDYNNWMRGVDRADQLRGVYRWDLFMMK